MNSCGRGVLQPPAIGLGENQLPGARVDEAAGSALCETCF